MQTVTAISPRLAILLFLIVALIASLQGCGSGDTDQTAADATSADGSGAGSPGADSTDSDGHDGGSSGGDDEPIDTTPTDHVGKLIQKDGTPFVDAATIRVYPANTVADDAAATPLAEVTATDGDFLLEDLAPGTYVLDARGADAALNIRCKTDAFLERDGAPLSLIMLPGGAIRGTAQADGTALAGARVRIFDIHEREEGEPMRAESASRTSAADGSFVFDYLLPGKKVVAIDKADGGAHEVAVEVEPSKVHDLGTIDV